MRQLTTYAKILFLLMLGSLSYAESPVLSPYSGPYQATVVRVIDGDTIEVDAEVWPGLVARYAVRERGIDAPEIRRVACEEERKWGEDAKAQLEKLYPAGQIIRLDDVALDGFGRVLADVRRLLPSDQFIPLERDMISRRLAVEWDPSMADVQWCLLATTRDSAD